MVESVKGGGSGGERGWWRGEVVESEGGRRGEGWRGERGEGLRGRVWYGVKDLGLMSPMSIHGCWPSFVSCGSSFCW